MNQDNNNLNQNNFNTQGNNEIPNNQQLQNNPNLNNNFNQNIQQNANTSVQTFISQPQLTPNYQQPINQMNIEQPTQQQNNTFESANLNNQNFNSKPPKKMNLGLIIGIVAAIVVIVVGIVFGSKLLSNGSNNNHTGKSNEGNNGKNNLYYNYSNNKNNNNITFTWSEQENIIYAINIERDNISKDIVISNSKIGNDVFQVSEYKHSANSNLTVKGLNNYNIDFSLTNSWQNETFDPNRQLINENDNQLLVHEYFGGDNYVVYIKTSQKYVRVSANISDEKLANDYFNYIDSYIKVATINYQNVDRTYYKLDLSSAKQNNNSIDISNWTFANDLIADIFRKDGLNIKSSSDIKSFSVNDGYSISVIQNLKDDSKIKTLLYTITSAPKGTYEKKDSVMEFKIGQSNWKITSTSNYHDYAKVKTNNGKEYSIEISYNNYDSEVIREVIKNSIISYFK